MEKILITGCAGFIGMHLCESLLKDGYMVIGIDNLNEYYNPILKIDRLEILKKYEAFNFIKEDITNGEELHGIFNKYRPKKVVNLAAQAGVRYSLINPHAYIDSNIKGFINILDCCKNYEISGLIYASSSSVYGSNTKMPNREKDMVNRPVSIYASTKIANEIMAYSYGNLYGLRTTGLRFFTAYGPWGRPDMSIYLFTKSIIEGTPIQVNNYGNMKRDFTYINDIVNGIKAAIDKNFECEIFNLGNNKPVDLNEMIDVIQKELNKKAVINYVEMQLGDVKESYADISHSERLLDFQPKTTLKQGIHEFVTWYKNNQNY